MTPEIFPAIPQSLAERFAKAFAAFVDAVRAAVTQNIPNPAVANTPAFLAWQTQALPLLEQENAAIQKAMALFLIGEEGTLIRLAADSRTLARKLDGFDLNFAGAENGKLLDQLETAVVVAAYQLGVAAGIR
jgi:uncharacterized protein CbrC (UPF0167 family)